MWLLLPKASLLRMREFDLVTVSSASHWFDIDALLDEARRILKPNGWLVIYENNFTGKMEGNDDFKLGPTTFTLQNSPRRPGTEITIGRLITCRQRVLACRFMTNLKMR